MRRIYFLAPDVETTHKIVEELRANGMEDHHMHILAKRDTPLGDLPEAGLSIKTDFIPAMERGALLGGSTGLLAGLVGLRFAGFAIGGGPILGILVASATIASLAAGLIGMSVGNSRLTQFEQAIEQGKLLVLLDIPKEQIETVKQSVIKHYPKAEFEGVEPLLPPGY
jgi:hypothetical protein